MVQLEVHTCGHYTLILPSHDQVADLNVHDHPVLTTKTGEPHELAVILPAQAAYSGVPINVHVKEGKGLFQPQS